jgi:AcrR family transcriptional regulator
MRVRDENKELSIRKKALKMIVKQGFDGFSMQKLAKEASISPATIYIYFKDREDLILQLFLEETKKMSEATLKGFNSNLAFSEGLKIQWMNRARYCMKHPLEVEFLEKMRHSPLYQKSLILMGDEFRNIMKEFVHNAIERKELVEVPLEVYWSVAFAPLYNLVKFHMLGTSVGGHKFSLNNEIMEGTLGLVLKALKP